MSDVRTTDQFLRSEYRAYRTLLGRLESEGSEPPLSGLLELKSVMDYLMRAAESEDPQRQLEKASAHLSRGAQDCYVALLSSRLDRIQAIWQIVKDSEQSDHFADGYRKVRSLVTETGPVQKTFRSATQCLEAIDKIDEFLDSYSALTSKVAVERTMVLARYRQLLITVLAALLGATLSSLVTWLLSK